MSSEVMHRCGFVVEPMTGTEPAYSVWEVERANIGEYQRVSLELRPGETRLWQCHRAHVNPFDL